MQLLVRRRLGTTETHHSQKLCEELRAEMPPSMPDEILRRGDQTTYRRAFQVRMEHISDDERLCLLSALLNDPEWIAAV